MNGIIYIITTFARVLADNPARLLPFLAFACVVTLIIAVTTDALLRARSLQRRKAIANRPVPRNPRELAETSRPVSRRDGRLHR
jgi:hypothetical protein